MTVRRSVHPFYLTLLAILGSVPPGFAELTPDQLAIVANRNSTGSMAVAKHYAERRAIPSNHVLALDLPATETITRADFEDKLVGPLRKSLESKGFAKKIRVLVTTYDVPLKVQAPRPTAQEQAWLKDATERQRFARTYLEKIAGQADRIGVDRDATGSESSSPESAVEPATTAGDHALIDRVRQSMQGAARRLAHIQEGPPDADAKRWAGELTRLAAQAGGKAALVQNLQPAPGVGTEQAKAELVKLQRQIKAGEQVIQILAETPSDVNRKRAYYLAERIFGLQGILRMADTELDVFGYKDADASVDSELALLWWDRGMYRISGRLPNPLYYENPVLGGKVAVRLPMLMVSRLDGPTVELSQQLVDQAMETETRGLTGTVYVDARGIEPDGAVNYGYYDQGLRNLAGLFRDTKSFEVVLDNSERRFSQRGEAPNAAVYVGWYRLRWYEDAFTFNRGAIGYHIASAEAVSVRDPKETGWCKNAIEHGIAATIGSTDEPFVDAFPLPNEFFALLLTGRYSLVEAYTMTTRWSSWRMVLFGDPLYNPWKHRGLVGEEKTVMNTIRAASGPDIGPFVLPFPDPLAGREQLKAQRAKLLAEVGALMDELERPSTSRPGR